MASATPAFISRTGKARPACCSESGPIRYRTGVKFHLFPDDPIIAFRPFKLNPDNYVVVRSMKDIEANLRLSGDNNAALWIHSQAESDEMEEVHAELNQIDLGVISNAFSYIPPMKGILNADFQYAPSDSAFMVVADMNIDDLYYENERVGELMFNAALSTFRAGEPSSGYAPFPGPERGECHYRLIPDGRDRPYQR